MTGGGPAVNTKNMRVKSITVHEYIGERQTSTCIYLFNDDCQLVQETHPDKVVTHKYLHDGKEYEERTRFNDGRIIVSRFEYDDEGDYVGEVCREGNGRVLYKETVNWIKPGRVVSTDRVYEDSTVLSFRRYHHKDERVAFIRGNGFFCTFEYDEEGNLLCEKLGSDTEDKSNPAWYSIRRFNKDGLLIGYTDENGVSSSREYEFDKYGNWVRVEGRIENGPVSMIIDRTIEYVPGVWTGGIMANDSSMSHITTKPKFIKA